MNIPRELLAKHRVFLGVLLAGCLLRAAVMLGYPRPIWFPDSFRYLAFALRPAPDHLRVGGYSLVLTLLGPWHSLALVLALQHLLGLAAGAAVYVLACRRFGARPWVAAVAVTPVLLDPFESAVEHMILADTLFLGLVTAAAVTVLWREEVTVGTASAAGLLLGCAAVVRSVGTPLPLVLVAALLLWRVGIRPVAYAAVCALLPVILYAFWYGSYHGRPGLTGSNGLFLYGRVSSFADCAVMRPPPDLRPLCMKGPRRTINWYLWNAASPLNRMAAQVGTGTAYGRAGEFARLAIEAQPAAYLRTVGGDLAGSLRWEGPSALDSPTRRYYALLETYPAESAARIRRVREYDPGSGDTVARGPWAAPLGFYQRHVFLNGALTGLLVAAGLAGVVLRRRARPALLAWAMGATLLLVPLMTATYDCRYVLAALPLFGLAAAAGCGDPLSARAARAASGTPARPRIPPPARR